jgi:hypothetical protein
MIRPDTFARASLALTALAFGGFGVWLIVHPQAIGLVGVELPGAAARVEIRAFYGGLELGIAAFFALAAARPGWFRPALFLQAASLGGMGIGRAAGMAIEGEATSMHAMLAVVELIGAAIGVVALSLLKHSNSE